MGSLDFGDKTGIKEAGKAQVIRRCLRILEYLKQGRDVSKKELAAEFGLRDERSIGEYINKHLKDYNIGTKKGYLFFKEEINLPTQLENSHLQYIKSSLEQLKGISGQAKSLATDLETKLNLHFINTPYFVKPQSFQPLYLDKYKGMLDDFYMAIKLHKKIQIVYDYRDKSNQLDNLGVLLQEDKVEKLIIDPYEISSFEGIWYLSALSEEDGGVRQFMLYRIDDYKLLKSSYTYDKKVKEIVSNTQTSHSLEGESITVKIKVKERIADYFKVKKHLSSQRVDPEEDEGDLIVSFIVTHLEEVDNLIKEWLPDIEILEPLTYKEKVKYELTQYLKSI